MIDLSYFTSRLNPAIPGLSFIETGIETVFPFSPTIVFGKDIVPV